MKGHVARFCKAVHLSRWMCQRRKFEWDEGFLTSRFKTRITTRLSRKVGQQQGKKLPRFQLNQMRQFSESLQCEVDKAGSDNNLVVGGKLKATKNICYNITFSSSYINCFTHNYISYRTISYIIQYTWCYLKIYFGPSFLAIKAIGPLKENI